MELIDIIIRSFIELGHQIAGIFSSRFQERAAHYSNQYSPLDGDK